MRILLDENLPHKLRRLLAGHDVRTVAYQEWAGLANGALLKAAEDAGFDAILTVNVNAILAAIDVMQPGALLWVELGSSPGDESAAVSSITISVVSSVS